MLGRTSLQGTKAKNGFKTMHKRNSKQRRRPQASHTQWANRTEEKAQRWKSIVLIQGVQATDITTNA